MPKVLVTGGAGFIASHVVDLLVQQGYRVIVVDNLSTGKRANVNKKAVLYKTDIRNQRALHKVFVTEKPDYVIHAAAQIQVVRSVDDPLTDAEINILGGINVLECCRELGVRKTIYLCTGGALYGEPEYLPADEQHPVWPISPYGASKHTLELYLHCYRHNFGLDFISLRFSNVYGPRDDVKSGRLIPNFVAAMRKGKRPFITGDGKQGRDFIYVGDVARAVVLALEKRTHSRFFNIGTEKVVSINEVFRIVQGLLKSRIKARYVAKRPGEVREIYLKADRARRELGWKAEVKIEEGLREYVLSVQ